MNEEKPDLSKLACKIVWRLNILCGRSDTSCKELTALTEKICDALETDDRGAQWSVLDEIKDFLEKSSEVHEDIRNVFQLFSLYVHLQDEV